jgi:hypothetical protein
MAQVSRELAAVNKGGTGSLRIYRPAPTAAFAPQDMAHRHQGAAAAALRSMGFSPVERRTGGHLAVYGSNALVIDLVGCHPDPRVHVRERFALFAGAIAEVLRGFSVDARVGPVAGEYCPGDYSINAQGCVKLAGIAQHIGRGVYHLGAVIAVEPCAKVRDAVSTAYRILDLDFEPRSFGALADLAEGVSFVRLRTALLGIQSATMASASISTS